MGSAESFLKASVANISNKRMRFTKKVILGKCYCSLEGQLVPLDALTAFFVALSWGINALTTFPGHMSHEIQGLEEGQGRPLSYAPAVSLIEQNA